MAELVAAAKAAPDRTREMPLVPGQRNRDDELATPAGERMELLREDVTPEEAAAAVARGALIVWGGCGCGPTDCGELEWIDGEQTRGEIPQLDHRARSAPSWLDLWGTESVEIVFAHGGLSWGRIIR